MDQQDVTIVKPKVSPLQAQAQQEPEPAQVETPPSETPPPEPQLEQKSEPEPESLPTPEALKGYYLNDPIFYQVCNQLGIDAQHQHVEAKKVSAIVDWAIRESNSTDPNEILWVIRVLDRKLPPASFEKRHNVLYRYVRLLDDKSKIDKEIRRYESQP